MAVHSYANLHAASRALVAQHGAAAALEAMSALNYLTHFMAGADRAAAYRLKDRMLAALYREGLCVSVALDVSANGGEALYAFVFAAGDRQYGFHTPVRCVKWHVTPTHDTPPAVSGQAWQGRVTADDVPRLMAVCQAWLREVG